MWIPDGEVRAIDDTVRAKPEEQIGHHFGKEARTVVDEGERHSQGAVHIWTACGNPAEIIETRQANMVDNEIQFGVKPGGLVNIAYVKFCEGERLDRRFIAVLHILYTEFA